MTRSQALAEFDKLMEDNPEYVTGASELVQNQIHWLDWLDHVADWEFLESDRRRILSAYRNLFGVLRPLVAQYVDGDE